MKTDIKQCSVYIIIVRIAGCCIACIEHLLVCHFSYIYGTVGEACVPDSQLIVRSVYIQSRDKLFSRIGQTVRF